MACEPGQSLIAAAISGVVRAFGRLAVKVPARRVAQALERLLALYDGTKGEGESAGAFFRRVELPRVKELLADLTAIDAGTASEEDFVDLGTDGAFAVNVTEGECSA